MTGSFPLTKKFEQALQQACGWHHGQFRKGTETPYIAHILGVASVALEFGATEKEAIAAVLHDALEDGPANTGTDAEVLRSQISDTFGEEVARLVDGATDATPKAGEQKEPWVTRKTRYLRKLRYEDAASLLVSASDKLHNARSILSDVLVLPAEGRDAYFNRFSQVKLGTLQYYRLLVDAYRAAPGAQDAACLQALFAELARTVTALEKACGVTADEVRAYPLLRNALEQK